MKKMISVTLATLGLFLTTNARAESSGSFTRSGHVECKLTVTSREGEVDQETFQFEKLFLDKSQTKTVEMKIPQETGRQASVELTYYANNIDEGIVVKFTAEVDDALDELGGQAVLEPGLAKQDPITVSWKTSEANLTCSSWELVDGQKVSY